MQWDPGSRVNNYVTELYVSIFKQIKLASLLVHHTNELFML